MKQTAWNASDLEGLVQVGQMFGKWCVQSSVLKLVRGHRKVHVKCSHKETWAFYDNLVSGKSKGCWNCGIEPMTKYKTELEKALRARAFAARSRCTNVNDPRYKDYGGRGITFGFGSGEEFVRYCLTLPGAGTDKEIDRIDNDKGYEPGNLRFADRAEQSKNTRRTVKVIYDGKEMAFKDFAREYTDLSYTRALIRYHEGWSLEAIASFVPPKVGRRASVGYIGRREQQQVQRNDDERAGNDRP